MTRKEYIIISILVIIILIFSMLIIISTIENPTENNVSMPYREVLANNSDDPGTVEVIRNIGNPNGSKIAYVVGVHPLEHETHETLVELLPEMANLTHSYDIYIINVSEGVGSYGGGFSDYDDPGRQNGQNLAYEYVYPEIRNGDYRLAIDVHSNVGAYDYKTFVFCPVKEGLGVEYAEDVANDCPDIVYFAPDSTTSGPYLTIPLNDNGIPAFYFEEYSFADQDLKDDHMTELILAVDKII
ncbi:hypothetical protein [Methanobrevibacter sp.]|uniref:hypothetical protein n=1 Tax=Methanobrevibacter sp. TaxID=66852 RepID=UPI0025E7689D|nr:hypothetical protein [Methanobrevibacter sp.]MBR4447967.1 hypothetical protein [Methanobrevibacter sp.]